MPDAPPAALGSVVALARYPVKSMMGEELNAAEVTERGLLGDRAFAVVDRADGKVASAKNPRKWGRLFDFRAAFVEPPRRGAPLPPVRITLPDGTIAGSEQPDVERLLSRAVGREATLSRTPPETPSVEYIPAPDAEETVVDIGAFMMQGTFFDYAAVHLLTTATLDRLRALYPGGRFEVRRFRPNIVVEAPAGAAGFVENAWVGRTLAIGDEVRLNVTTPCPRCVMTTLPQGDLPKDPGILRAAAEHNCIPVPLAGDAPMPSVGVYAFVARGGTVRRGDAVRLAD